MRTSRFVFRGALLAAWLTVGCAAQGQSILKSQPPGPACQASTVYFVHFPALEVQIASGGSNAVRVQLREYSPSTSISGTVRTCLLRGDTLTVRAEGFLREVRMPQSPPPYYVVVDGQSGSRDHVYLEPVLFD